MNFGFMLNQTLCYAYASVEYIANVKFGNEGVFLFDPHTLGVLTEEQEDASLLVGFCKKGE